MDPIPLLLLTKETTGEFVLSDVEQNNRPNMYKHTLMAQFVSCWEFSAPQFSLPLL